MNTLPEKLWELLEIAKGDALAILEDKNYILDMGEWHQKGAYYAPRCSVCLAGAVMARHLGVPCDVNKHPHDYAFAIGYKLRAINNVRGGNYITALRNLYQTEYFPIALPREFYIINECGDKPSLHGSTTKQDIEAFFAHPVMLAFVALLKKHDL